MALRALLFFFVARAAAEVPVEEKAVGEPWPESRPGLKVGRGSVGYPSWCSTVPLASLQYVPACRGFAGTEIRPAVGLPCLDWCRWVPVNSWLVTPDAAAARAPPQSQPVLLRRRWAALIIAGGFRSTHGSTHPNADSAMRRPSETLVAQDLARLPLAECAPTGAVGFQPSPGGTLPNAEDARAAGQWRPQRLLWLRSARRGAAGSRAPPGSSPSAAVAVGEKTTPGRCRRSSAVPAGADGSQSTLGGTRRSAGTAHRAGPTPRTRRTTPTARSRPPPADVLFGACMCHKQPGSTTRAAPVACDALPVLIKRRTRVKLRENPARK
eukprot:CAMPEP_0181488000 /NCGR_PEP_ID=MMETSP1110-20121109/48138_1 /TAXON_ID=174948 /ORGANISM="Symbiodinium sp., Strain CCMP421" /LENGTH=324 /DNA_ID=CAMNT_0023614583 /DNA_START=65 /DNA_END=1040 /DNA_ORIENTATION=+